MKLHSFSEQERCFYKIKDLRMIRIPFIIALIGFLIALYTYLLEKKIKFEPEFKPLCDISDSVSCTKPMKSKYASLFYFSNALLAMIFYGLIAIVSFFDARLLLTFLSALGCIGSCFFAYILFFKLKTLCLLCVLMYACNFLIFYESLNR